MRKLAIRFIRFYQRNKPEHRKKWCRYHPTCSNYAIQAYEKYNFFYASILAMLRILRCNPLFKGGYNPVPLTKKEKAAQKNVLLEQTRDESDDIMPNSNKE